MNQIHNENIITMLTPDSSNWVFSNCTGLDVTNSLRITPTAALNTATRNVSGFDVSYNNLTIHIKGRVINAANTPFHDITLNIPGVGTRVFRVLNFLNGETREINFNHSFDVVLPGADFDLEFSQTVLLAGTQNYFEIDVLKVSQSEITTNKIRTYFFLGSVFEQAMPNKTGRINISQYSINGVSQLTSDFINDQLNLPGSFPINEWGYANCNVDSSACGVAEQYEGFNPFFDEALLDFNDVDGEKRGRAIGSIEGKDYGAGIFNIGVDKQSVLDANGTLRNGAFYVDIDYSKSFRLVIKTFISNRANAYVNSIYSKQYSIAWDKKVCERKFLEVDISKPSPVTTDIQHLGFLNGNLTPGQLSQYKIDELCNGYIIPKELCPYKERTLSFATRIILPELPPEDKGYAECCYEYIVLAHLVDTDNYKNDFNGFYHQKQLNSETVKFNVTGPNGFDEDITNDDFGLFINNHLDNEFLETFIIDWRKVLIDNGPGYYQVEKEVVIAGITINIPLGGFNLAHFTNVVADKTMRVDAVMNGLLVSEGVDFTNTNFKTSLRSVGFFGNREPGFNEDNLIKGNYTKEQISISQENEYKMQMIDVPVCVTKELFNFILLSNELFMNDYNLNNHSYEYRNFAVTISGNEGSKYINTSRKAEINLTFNKKTVNAIKRNY